MDLDPFSIPAFLKIPQAARNAQWLKQPPQPPAFAPQPATKPTTDPATQTILAAQRQARKAKASNRIARMKQSLDTKIIPPMFRRWDPRRGRFVDEREDQAHRLQVAARKLGIHLTQEPHPMPKLLLVPYLANQDTPNERGRSSIDAAATPETIAVKAAMVAKRAGQKTQRVEVVDEAGLLIDTWTASEDHTTLQNTGGMSIALDQPQQEPTVAKKAKKTKTKTKTKTNGTGVIATIVETMKRDRGATQEEILAALTKKFPDRKAKSMASTIKIQAAKNAKKKEKDDKRGLIYYA